MKIFSPTLPETNRPVVDSSILFCELSSFLPSPQPSPSLCTSTQYSLIRPQETAIPDPTHPQFVDIIKILLPNELKTSRPAFPPLRPPPLPSPSLPPSRLLFRSSSHLLELLHLPLILLIRYAASATPTSYLSFARSPSGPSRGEDVEQAACSPPLSLPRFSLPCYLVSCHPINKPRIDPFISSLRRV